MARRAAALVGQLCWSRQSPFSEAKKLSASALSQHWPVRPTERRISDHRRGLRSRGWCIGRIQLVVAVFGLEALGPDGRPATITMGSYGVGISRAVAALAEQTHDDKGLCWPRVVAPADVHIVATGREEAIFESGERLAAELVAAGVRVLLDDRRGVSAGVKFADAELLGMPTSLIVGRGLADGVVELRDRASGRVREVAVADAVTQVRLEVGRP